MPWSHGKVFYVHPSNSKDVNDMYVWECRKNIKTFKEEFDKLSLVPTEETGFDILLELGVSDMLKEEYIKGYLAIEGVSDIVLDKLESRLYLNVAKPQGIKRGTVARLVRSIAAGIVDVPSMQYKAVNEVIIEQNGVYKYRRVTTSGVSYEAFTNFVLDVLGFIHNKDGSVDTLVNARNLVNGEYSFIITSEHRSSEMEFIREISRVPGIAYTAPAIKGFHTLFMNFIDDSDARHYYAPAIIGKLDTGEWLLPEGGIDLNGKYVEAAEDGTIDLGGKLYLEPRRYIDPSLLGLSIQLPPQGTAVSLEDRRSLVKMFLECYGEVGGIMPLGYVMSMYIKDIVRNDLRWGFPICYITGNAEAGKSTLARLVLKGFGITDSSFSADSSMFGIGKLSSIYSQVPLWFDDIRDIGEQGVWNKIMLASYENSKIIKGTKEQRLADTVEYNSGFLITSEFFMTSPAAASRCIRVELDKYNQDRSKYPELKNMVDRVLPYIGRDTIMLAQTKRVDIRRCLQDTATQLEHYGFTERKARNTAVGLTGLAMMLNLEIEACKDLWVEIMQRVVAYDRATAEEDLGRSYAYAIIDELTGLFRTKEFLADYVYNEDWVVKDDRAYLFTDKLYQAWCKHTRTVRGGKEYSRQELMKQLRGLPFAVKGSNNSSIQHGGVRHRAVVINISDEYKGESEIIDEFIDVVNIVALKNEAEKLVAGEFT